MKPALCGFLHDCFKSAIKTFPTRPRKSHVGLERKHAAPSFGFFLEESRAVCAAELTGNVLGFLLGKIVRRRWHVYFPAEEVVALREEVLQLAFSPVRVKRRGGREERERVLRGAEASAEPAAHEQGDFVVVCVNRVENGDVLGAGHESKIVGVQGVVACGEPTGNVTVRRALNHPLPELPKRDFLDFLTALRGFGWHG